MGTQITITTDDAALAADLISLINGNDGPAPAVAATPAPAKKATPAKKAAAPAPAPEPEPEVEAEEESVIDDDVLGGDDEAVYTMADAVARATELVQASKAAQVKEALADLGVAKVSHLKADQISAFMAAVEGA